MIIYDGCQEEAFGEERLRQVILASARGSAQEVLWAITGALAGFVGETELAEGGVGGGGEVGEKAKILFDNCRVLCTIQASSLMEFMGIEPMIMVPERS